MKISVIQPDTRLGDFGTNFDNMQRLLYDSLKSSPDVILLPELWPSGFYPENITVEADTLTEKGRLLLSRFAEENRVNIVGGSLPCPKGEYITNTCLVFDRSGAVIHRYSKCHLFSPSGEDKAFKPGDALTTFNLEGANCAVAICYDVRFPEFIRKAALENIDLLFIPAAWPERRLIHWQTLLRARAIENQIFVAAANSAGEMLGEKCAGSSTIIDPWGEILAAAGESENIISANLRLIMRHQIKETIDVFCDRRPELY